MSVASLSFPSFESRFTRGKFLGKGGFGEVHEVTPTKEGKAELLKHFRTAYPGAALPPLIVKTNVVEPGTDAEASAKNLSREIHSYLNLWSHPNVTRCFGIYADAARHTELVLEYARGPESGDGPVSAESFATLSPEAKNVKLGSPADFFRYVLTRGGLEERVAKFVFYQVIAAAESLHLGGDEAHIHRDLKPENTLVFGETPVGDGASRILVPKTKISDFGTTRSVPGDGGGTVTIGAPSLSLTGAVIGAIRWAWTEGSPELLRAGLAGKGKAAYGTEFDAYCLGSFMYQTLSGGYKPFHQFEGESNRDREIRASNGPVSKTWSDLKGYYHAHKPSAAPLSDACIELLQHLITESPAGRFSTTEALDHAFFQDAAFRTELAQFYKDSGLCATGIPERPKPRAGGGAGAGGAKSAPPAATSEAKSGGICAVA